MSVLFEHNEEVVWQLSSGNARALMQLVEGLEQRFGCVSGMSRILNDEVQVNESALRGFVETLGATIDEGRDSLEGLLLQAPYAVGCGLLAALGTHEHGAGPETARLAKLGKRLVRGSD